ncbi:copper resistance protein CopC [Cupriavidus sp. USMAHM13]|uniref:copper homeostasis periplasmic binding protein CopC n=1 Tax=Cupriavidus sp. USMAHM13 TaxID=1389192 RepID=UPI0008A703FA|nr:copper homeostasis periplasmic binding protein CopC [Cupriavidus sp. USMAHM13]AOY98602.1 copper resistance protein CopC [Cupriavidus sp. USMAHM13]
MTSMISAARPLLAAAAILASTAALAHPRLVSSSPAEGAEGAAPQRIELHFSENLVKQFSGANLVMTGMPGMSDHAAMKVASSVSGGDDPKTMLITPKSPLVPGTYRVEWRAVSSDTHSITGAINFKVN